MTTFSFRTGTIFQSLRNGTCLLLAGLLTVGTPVLAGDTPEIRSSDVALNTGGVLKGTVLNGTAQPVAGVPVNMLHQEKLVATTMSNDEGEFTFKGLRNGAHVVQVGMTQESVRLWDTQTAPPAAVEDMAIVVDEEIVRGQMATGILPPGSLGTFIANNAGALLLIGGATAIALGTTLGNSHHNAAPASP